jgi:hypothetical protein
MTAWICHLEGEVIFFTPSAPMYITILHYTLLVDGAYVAYLFRHIVADSEISFWFCTKL